MDRFRVARGSRVALAGLCFALPVVLLLAACGENGKTPDCSPGAGCEPTVPNANPDAGRDADADAKVDAPTTPDTGDAADGNVGDGSDGGDARSDGDAKPG